MNFICVNFIFVEFIDVLTQANNFDFGSLQCICQQQFKANRGETSKTEFLAKRLILYVLGDMKSFLFGGVCVAFLADVENLWWPVSTIVSRFSWFLPTLPLDMIVSAAGENVIKQTMKHIPCIPTNYTKISLRICLCLRG